VPLVAAVIAPEENEMVVAVFAEILRACTVGVTPDVHMTSILPTNSLVSQFLAASTNK
jgi:hypothetical protein